MFKRFFALFIVLTFLLHAAGVRAASVYVTVQSRDELIELIREKAATLTPEVYVRINDYNQADYTADFCELLPLEAFEMRGTQRGGTAELTYTLKYTQAERVLYSLQGGDIWLNTKEELTAGRIQEIYDSIIKEDMTDYEKQLALHDYLVVNVAYDQSGEPSEDAYTAYGAVINQKAVCQGYTEAARILLSMADIWNGTLTGHAGGQDHIWNVVEIEGELYHMDVTWDSGLVFEDGSRALSHAYLNVTDKQIGQSHRWNKDLQDEKFGEECTADEYNYFKREGLVVRSNEEYIKLAAKKYNAGVYEVEAQFDGISIDNADILGAARQIGSSGFTGFPVPDMNVLWIRFK